MGSLPLGHATRRRHHRHPRQPPGAARPRCARIDELEVDGALLRRRPGGLRAASQRGLRADRRARDPDDLRQLRPRHRARPRGLRLRLRHAARPRARAALGRLDAGAHRRRRARTSCATCPSTCASRWARRRCTSSTARRARSTSTSSRTSRPASTSASPAAEEADVLVFGHTHKPWIHEFGGVLFVNCGSVGKPKDGDPRARLRACSRPTTGRRACTHRARRLRRRPPSRARSPPSGLPAEFADKLVAGRLNAAWRPAASQSSFARWRRRRPRR